ncbi:MAG TPA: protein phosphatase 2C domain-containing protein [Gammaproteobacteria bacterium]|nr:protein phosphatase 2C domain-containing protein [Gammaproteobacteria bacterium]
MSDTTVRRPIKWSSFAESNVGTVRTINEDSILAKPETSLWAIADGMGGYEAGDVASSLIVKTLDELAYKDSLSEIVNAVEDTLIDVNHRILEYADIMLDGRMLGSTVVSLIIRGRVGACVWAGDSRLYRFRNGQLQQLSRDHSHVEELMSQGHITAEEAANHPDSNVITRAVGAHEELYLDLNVFNLQVGDTLLLCSDGLYNAIKQPDIIPLLSLPTPEKIVKELLATALKNGASDNVSIIIVKGEPGSVPAQSRADATENMEEKA